MSLRQPNFILANLSRGIFAVTVAVTALTSVALANPATRATPPALDPGAVVFVYNRFGDDRNPGSSIRIDQFVDHIDELVVGGYTVLPLVRVIEAVRGGDRLPDRTISVTIDDATLSAYREAYPRLRTAGVPFTLFVATDAIDGKLGSHMSWDQVRELYSAGVTIGALTASALPMAERSAQENRDDIKRGKARFLAELGFVPELFAYPHGENSLPVRNIVEQAGFLAAFGQQSGVAYPGAEIFNLPRFIMNDSFGSIDRFRLAANALPLPVTDVTPADPVLVGNPPILGFTVPDGIGNLGRLACFATGQGRTAVEQLGSNRIEVRIADAFPPGRARVNCTLPAEDDRWRWFGVQLFIPEP
ncbi:MAG: polysaccharide deacetylase family protein [Rhodospirillaceae bacterium]